MRIVEAALVFAVAALDLAVVAGRAGPDELVADARFSSGSFKQRRPIPIAIGETVGELKAVARLNTSKRSEIEGLDLYFKNE